MCWHACGLSHRQRGGGEFRQSAMSSLGIVRAVRDLRGDVPVLVRTADDVGIAELCAAGATEVVPETFEASLMLVSQVLMLLNVSGDAGGAHRGRDPPRPLRHAARRAAAGRHRAMRLEGDPGEGIASIVHSATRLGGGPVAGRGTRRVGPRWPSPRCADRASPAASLMDATMLRGGDVLVIYGHAGGPRTRRGHRPDRLGAALTPPYFPQLRGNFPPGTIPICI